MKIWLSLTFTALLQALCFAQSPPARPAITGIAVVEFYAADLHAATDFYHGKLGLPVTVNGPEPRTFTVNRFQSIVIQPIPESAATTTRLAAVGLRTANVEQMRKYLQSQGIATEIRGLELRTTSPAGTAILFVPDTPSKEIAENGKAVSVRILHAGWVVHDRDAEERFFRDVLGFRPYWSGGAEGKPVEWVSLQVPDGHDWVELMLRSGEDDLKTKGIFNHVSLGVESIDVAEQILKKNGLPADQVQPKLGRDGKWQMNLYDAEHTRVELMEFTPRGTTCCSPFTAEHPSASDSHP